MHYEESVFLDGVPGGEAVYVEDVSVEERLRGAHKAINEGCVCTCKILMEGVECVGYR